MNPMFVSAGLASLGFTSCGNHGSRATATSERPGKVETPQGAMGPPNDVDLDGRPNWRDKKVAFIERLPTGYRVVEHDGKRYYRSGKVFYQSREIGYVVVRDPLSMSFPHDDAPTTF